MLRLDNFKCLLFDLDDTLLRNSWKLLPSFIAKTCLALRKDCGSLGTVRGLRALKKIEFNTKVSLINHERFINVFSDTTQIPIEKSRNFFDEIVPNILVGCRHHFETILPAKLFVELFRGKVPLVLATNPILPESITNQRIQWAGLETKDFQLVTHSENMHYCKPSLEYYEEILCRLNETGISKNECLFIGNDPRNDGVAVNCGITTILIDEKHKNNLKLLHGKDMRRAALYRGSWASVANELKLPFEVR